MPLPRADELGAARQATEAEVHSTTAEQANLAKAVRALVLDAELRCALDERELEFLWAAPSQVYGQHGWRRNKTCRLWCVWGVLPMKACCGLWMCG